MVEMSGHEFGILAVAATHDALRSPTLTAAPLCNLIVRHWGALSELQRNSIGEMVEREFKRAELAGPGFGWAEDEAHWARVRALWHPGGST